MPDKPCCAKCGREYKTVKVGVGVLEHKGDGSLYRISAADLLECPGCGHQITWGYGRAIHYSAEPQKVKHEIEQYEKYTTLIKVY
ncbi:unnamed protein product [marine sediment metagenome]|uniref:Uncharacterized protein n=1 Tax=marine sediment metagenome TaxID=412755 RepID=X1TS14_9ZZZZ